MSVFLGRAFDYFFFSTLFKLSVKSLYFGVIVHAEKHSGMTRQAAQVLSVCGNQAYNQFNQ